MAKSPSYIQRFKDRHGKYHCYLNHPDYPPRVPLRAPYDTPEFWAERDAILEAKIAEKWKTNERAALAHAGVEDEAPKYAEAALHPPIVADAPKGSFADLCNAYLRSPRYRNLAPQTKQTAWCRPYVGSSPMV
jgi:hypothetical protein